MHRGVRRESGDDAEDWQLGRVETIMNQYYATLVGIITVSVLSIAEQIWIAYGFPPAPFLVGFLTAVAYCESQHHL